MSKAFNRLQSRMVRFHVSEPYSNTEETRARYILSFVCREMQRRFHNALESLFMAPAALPIREVISASMEPSAEMIEPRYVNEGTDSTSSPSIHKNSLKSDHASYRDPYHCIVCKVMEHIIVSNIWKHLHLKHDIILHFQHRFQSGLSCESQLIETVSDWMMALDNKTQIDAIRQSF